MSPAADTHVRVAVVDNQVRMIGGTDGLAPATLVVPSSAVLDVRINGNRVVGRRMVSTNDTVDAFVMQEDAKRTATVVIRSDGLQATLRIELKAGVRRVLRSVEPSVELTLAWDEEAVEPIPFTFTEIMNVLNQQKVSYQLDHAAIVQLIESGLSGECVCAVGKPPEPQVPDRYEVIVKEQEQVNMVGIIPIQSILSVVSDVVVAEYRPGRQGVAGVSVRNEPLPPAPVKSRLPRLGNGVVLRENGQVISTRSGRVIQTQQLLDVANTMVVDRSLQASDGYLVFDGDVHVKGDVAEGSQITAGGCVFVSGLVSSASISADHTITVSGGVFASTLRAGMRTNAITELHEWFGNIVASFRPFILSTSQLQQALQARGSQVPVGAVAIKLMEEKFSSLLDLCKRFEQWCTQHQTALGTLWSTYVRDVSSRLQPQWFLRLQHTHELESFIAELESHMADLQLEQTEQADIVVRNAQNSDLAASGTIKAVNQGFYQSRIQAGQAVLAQGSPGVVLACQVKAMRVVAREIGSQAGAITEIVLTDKEGVVKADRIYPGTKLELNTWKHNVMVEMVNVQWP